MKIALDYDETFTADREGWNLFVQMMKQRGHDITFVTFRSEDHPSRGNNDDILEDAAWVGIPIVFTNHKQKSHVFQADVWIDDMPVLIPKYTELVGMASGCEFNGDTA